MINETQQRVFMIFVRPYYTDANGNKVYYSGASYVPNAISAGTTGHADQPLLTENTIGAGALNNSADGNGNAIAINTSKKFVKDPWFLHSTYTSYVEYQINLKGVIAMYGTGKVLCTSYIPVDYQVLPNQ